MRAIICIIDVGTESLATPVQTQTSQGTTQATQLTTQDSNISQLLQPTGLEVAARDLQRHLSHESTEPLKRRRSEQTDTQESISENWTTSRPKRAASMKSKLRAAIDSDEDENDLMSFI